MSHTLKYLEPSTAIILRFRLALLICLSTWGFDEFKSNKDAKGSMSFIFPDFETHEIIDIARVGNYAS